MKMTACSIAEGYSDRSSISDNGSKAAAGREGPTTSAAGRNKSTAVGTNKKARSSADCYEPSRTE